MSVNTIDKESSSCPLVKRNLSEIPPPHENVGGNLPISSRSSPVPKYVADKKDTSPIELMTDPLLKTPSTCPFEEPRPSSCINGDETEHGPSSTASEEEPHSERFTLLDSKLASSSSHSNFAKHKLVDNFFQSDR